MPTYRLVPGGFSPEAWTRYLAVEAQEFSAGSLWPASLPAQRSLLHLLNQHVKGGSILDVGCGDGWLVEHLIESHWDAWGMTINPEERRHAGMRRALLLERIAVGDAHNIPFEAEGFDAVYARESIEHCIAPFVALWEVNRVLIEGGVFLLHTSSEQWIGEPSHRWVPTWRQGFDMLAKTGFEVLLTRTISEDDPPAVQDWGPEGPPGSYGDWTHHVWLARQARRMPESWARGPWFPYMAEEGQP
jgi:SAM-dependent methyltransferase